MDSGETDPLILLVMKLVTKAGTYEADTFWKIIIMVISHRFWHLRTHGKWMD